MKKNVTVICSVILAVCIGLGIPLVTANVQDSTVLNKTESLTDAVASLGLNGRGSVSVAEKYELISSAYLYESELSSGKYMLEEQVREKATEYAQLLLTLGARCVDVNSDHFYFASVLPMLIGDQSGERPSITAWRVLMFDDNCEMRFLIDDETGLLLGCEYIASDYKGIENAKRIEPDLDLIERVVGMFAAQCGAMIVNIYEDSNTHNENANTVYIVLDIPGSEVEENGETQGDYHLLQIELNDGTYVFDRIARLS